MDISDRESTKKKADEEPTDIDEAYSASIVEGSLNSDDTTGSIIFTEDFDISETVSGETENTESTDVIRAYSRESSSVESSDIDETIGEFLQSTLNWQVAFSLATDIVADISNKVTEHFTKIEKIRESATNINSMKTENITIDNTESSNVDRASSESFEEQSSDIKETKRKIEKFLELSQISQIGFSTVNTVVADISDKVTEELIELEKTQKIKICPVETAKITISEANDPDRANSASYVDEFIYKKETLENNTLKVDLKVPKTILVKTEGTESTDVTPKSVNIEETCSFGRVEEQKNVDKIVESIVELNVAANTQISCTEIVNTTFESLNVSSDCELELAKVGDRNENVIEDPSSVEMSKGKTRKSDKEFHSIATQTENSGKFKWFRNHKAEGNDVSSLVVTSSEKLKHTFKSPEHYKNFYPKSLTTGPPISPCPPEPKKISAVDLCSSNKEFVPKSSKEVAEESPYLNYKEFVPRVQPPTCSDHPKPKEASTGSLNVNSKEFVPRSLTVQLSTSSGLPKPREIPFEPLKIEPLSSGLPKPKEVSAGPLNVNSKEFVPSTSSGLPKPNEIPIESLKVEPLSTGLSKPKKVSAGSLNVNSKEFVPRSLKVESSTSSDLPKTNEVHIEPLKVEPLSSGFPKSKEVSAGSLNLNSKEFVPRSLEVEPSTSSGLPKTNDVPIEPLKVKPLSSSLSKPKEISAGSLNVNSKEFVPEFLRVEHSTSSGLPKPNEVPNKSLKPEPLSSGLPKPKVISAGSLNFKEFVPRSLRVEISTSSNLPKPNEVHFEQLKIEPLTSSDLPKPKEIPSESLNLNSKEFVPGSLRVESSTSSDLPDSKEVSAESLNLNYKEFAPRSLRVEPSSSSDLPKLKEVSAESLTLNYKEFAPRSLGVEPSISSDLPKSKEVSAESLNLNYKEFVPRSLRVEAATSSDLPKTKEVSAESLNLNYKEFAPRSLKVEPSTSDLPKSKKVSAESLNLNYKDFAPRSLRAEAATSSDLPKPKEVSAESLNLNYKEFAPKSLRVEPSNSSDLPKSKEISAESLNLNYKEFAPRSLRVEAATSSDLPKPKEVSAESLNLNYKKFAPRSLRVEGATSSDLPKSKEMSTESLNLNYKEFAPRSLRVEPSSSSDLPKLKEVSAESLTLNYKEFAPRSLGVEPSISSDLPKPKEVSAESLNLNYKEFAPRSLRVESSTSPDLPKLKEVLAEALNLNYKEFAPRSLKVEHSASSDLPILEESLCSNTPMEVPTEVTSKVLDPKKVLTPEIPVHSFLATLDAVLLVLEGTLAGAYRISQNYTGPSIPLVIKNTMHSVRLSLETLRTHFGYTEQECFEPLSSILRDLLTPAVTLFSDICPELAYDLIDFYPTLEMPEPTVAVPIPPEQLSRPEFVISPRNIYGSTVYDRYPIPVPQCVPRIPLYTDSFEDTKLGVFVTPDGFIRMLLPYTFEIDLTIDGAICVRNIKDKTIAAISGCGNYSGMATGLCRVHQRGKVVEMRITDEFSNKNMYGKIGVRGVYFGGTDTPANMHLKDNGETIVSPINFSNLDTDFIRDVFVNHSLNGPVNYDACCAALRESKEKTLVDGSVHFCWRNIKITQYKNGEVVVNRKNGDFMIWCSPEVLNLYTGTEKKGIIKVVTPMTRVVSTVMSTPVREHEKFFLANLGNQWVYYNTVDFLASNQVYSAGYTDVTEEKKAEEAVRNA